MDRLLALLLLVAGLATAATLGFARGTPADLAVLVSLPGTDGPEPALDARFAEVFGAGARTAVDAADAGLPLHGWGLERRHAAVAWVALAAGLAVLGVAAGRRAPGAALAGAGFTLVAGAVLLDATNRDARELALRPGAAVALLGGETARLLGMRGAVRGPLLVALTTGMDEAGGCASSSTPCPRCSEPGSCCGRGRGGPS